MTSERARAYTRVLAALDGLGGAKLHPAEDQVVREAADALLFSPGPGVDEEARAAVIQLDQLLDRLVDADRLEPDTADALAETVEACGPQPLPA